MQGSMIYSRSQAVDFARDPLLSQPRSCGPLHSISYPDGRGCKRARGAGWAPLSSFYSGYYFPTTPFAAETMLAVVIPNFSNRSLYGALAP